MGRLIIATLEIKMINMFIFKIYYYYLLSYMHNYLLLSNIKMFLDISNLNIHILWYKSICEIQM